MFRRKFITKSVGHRCVGGDYRAILKHGADGKTLPWPHVNGMRIVTVCRIKRQQLNRSTLNDVKRPRRRLLDIQYHRILGVITQGDMRCKKLQRDILHLAEWRMQAKKTDHSFAERCCCRT